MADSFLRTDRTCFYNGEVDPTCTRILSDVICSISSRVSLGVAAPSTSRSMGGCGDYFPSKFFQLAGSRFITVSVRAYGTCRILDCWIPGLRKAVSHDTCNRRSDVFLSNVCGNTACNTTLISRKGSSLTPYGSKMPRYLISDAHEWVNKLRHRTCFFFWVNVEYALALIRAYANCPFAQKTTLLQ